MSKYCNYCVTYISLTPVTPMIRYVTIKPNGTPWSATSISFSTNLVPWMTIINHFIWRNQWTDTCLICSLNAVMKLETVTNISF